MPRSASVSRYVTTVRGPLTHFLFSPVGTVLIALLVLLLGALIGVQYERAQQRSQQAEITRLQSNFERAIKAEKEKFAVRAKEFEIIDQAAAKQQAENRDLLESLSALESRLTFYRRMARVRPEPIAVEGFEVQRTQKKGVVKYRLLVVRNSVASKPTQAEVQIKVSDGRKSYNLVLDKPQVSLRYYQVFNGQWVIPPGFAPKRVDVDIKADKAQVKRRFKWELTQ